jgi:hypothetical protein
LNETVVDLWMTCLLVLIMIHIPYDLPRLHHVVMPAYHCTFIGWYGLFFTSFTSISCYSLLFILLY